MLLFIALLTGLAVAGITVLADRCGQKIGGLIATAPVTSTVGVILVLQTATTSADASAIILAGNYSVLSSFAAIVGYVAVISATTHKRAPVRIFLAELVFFALYLFGIVLCRKWLPLGVYLFGIDAIGAVLVFIFFCSRLKFVVPPLKKMKYTTQELMIRFAVGAIAVVIIRSVASLETIFAGALSVFPAVFTTSLGVMGIRQSPEFSASAAKSGIFGVVAIALFVGGYSLWIPKLYPQTTITLTMATLTALICYFFGLFFFRTKRFQKLTAFCS